MSTLLILTDENAYNTVNEHEDVIRCCVGLRGRVGDKYQCFRDLGDVEFTEGMNPLYYFAKRGVFFDTIVDWRSNYVYGNVDEGLDRFPD